MAVDGVLSDYAPVISGVPQGTILGPVLFLLYINDLPEYLNLDRTKLKLYADDVKIYVEIVSPQSHINLQQTLDRVVEWAQTWQLQLAVAKCQVLTISNKRAPEMFPYTMHAQQLQRVNNVRDLGVVINSKLNFGEHCSKILKSAYARQNLLFRILKFSDFEVFLHAYKVYIRPMIESATIIWNPYTVRDVQKVESLQRSFTFRVFRRFNMPYMDYDRRCKVCNLESLSLRRMKFDILYIYKIIHGLVSSDLISYIAFDRTGTKLRPYCGLDRTAHFFLSRVVQLYNSVPDFVRNGSLRNLQMYLDSDEFRRLARMR